MKIIGYIKTDFKTKFGAPRQGGIVKGATGRIVFCEEYRDASAFRGLEGFSHIWVLWMFSETKRESWSPTVRPPLLGGNKRLGVFATRSPYRPNNIAMSALKLDKIEFTEGEGPILWVSGCDMMDNTPIVDIKPYLPYSDIIADASGGFTDALQERRLEVVIDDESLGKIEAGKRETLLEVLRLDPRPSYQNDEKRIYGMEFSDYEIKFSVSENKLIVLSVEENKYKNQ